MTRSANAITLTVLALCCAFAPAALQARSAAPYYTAELAAPTEEGSVVAGGVVFTCTDTRCIAPRGSDRPLRVCSELRREVGTIASFTANGDALTESRLSRCNG